MAFDLCCSTCTDGTDLCIVEVIAKQQVLLIDWQRRNLGETGDDST